MGVYFFSDNPNGFCTGKRFSINAPAPTIMAAGMAGDSLGHWHFANDGRRDHPMTDVPKVPRPGKPPQLFDRGEKPPYRVPLMEEIRRIRTNGLTVVSTFAGAGGSSTGYRLAGFKVLYANEFVPIAQESYMANCAPHTVMDGRSVKDVTAEEILRKIGLKRGELDVFDGSPPCQAFSTAGKREKGWGTERSYEHGASQKNEELFFDYIRLRDGLMPKVFVAENVSGLVKGVAKGFFLEILKELKRGYRVSAPLLDAQWLGVPQARQRIVFIGVREDLGVDPPKIEPLPYRYSVRDALPWLGSVVHDTRGSFKSGGTITDRPAVTIMSSAFDAHHFKVTEAAPEVVHDSGRKNAKRRSIGGEPCPTIVSTPNAAYHYRVEGAVGFNQHKPSSVDAPMPAVMAGRPVSLVGTSNAPHGSKNERRSIDEPSGTIMARRANVQVEEEAKLVGDGPSLDGQAIGREYDRLNPGQQSDKYFSLVRADPGEPSPTLTASGGANAGIATVVHPTEKRKFTILEVKRLCSFPDDFVLVGSYSQQWERLGNSVPPVMMQKVAEAIRDAVLLPARARTAARAGPRRARSTTGKPRKGGGKAPPRAARPGAAGKAAGEPAGRRPSRRRRPKEPTGEAAVDAG